LVRARLRQLALVPAAAARFIEILQIHAALYAPPAVPL